jgi:hypothetical protein
MDIHDDDFLTTQVVPIEVEVKEGFVNENYVDVSKEVSMPLSAMTKDGAGLLSSAGGNNEDKEQSKEETKPAIIVVKMGSSNSEEKVEVVQAEVANVEQSKCVASRDGLEESQSASSTSVSTHIRQDLKQGQSDNVGGVQMEEQQPEISKVVS